VFTGREVLVRIDPGEGKGHHSKVVTGGAQSKFGVSVDQLQTLLPLLKQHNTRVVGLHIHAGSGVMQPNLWETNAQFMGDLIAKFPHLRILDLGGGLVRGQKSCYFLWKSSELN
jgi:diaminopimelate decarboxylase/aspartate kinase